jgi:hypothetical protein
MKRFVMTVIMMLLCVISVRAEEKKIVFTIDFTTILMGFDDKPIAGFDCKPGQVAGKDCEAMTLGDAAVFAIRQLIEADRSLDFKQKYLNGELAKKIRNNKEAVLSSEEISTLKDRIGKIFGTDVVYAAGLLIAPDLHSAK